MALRELGRTEEALASFERTLQIEPGCEYLYGMWLFNKMAVCDWREVEADFARLYEMIERGERASPPFPVLVTPSSPALQKKAAEDWIRACSRRTSLRPAAGRILHGS